MKSAKLSALFILVAVVGVLRADNSEEPESSDTEDAHKAFCTLDSSIQSSLAVCLYSKAPEDVLRGQNKSDGNALVAEICKEGVDDFPRVLMEYLETVRDLVMKCIQQMEEMA
ncbi:hypothetical protein V5799_006685 [Amblyomma americanum]|uniref:Secreted protein n=1 Tax=Amblyomma americanum TaxID=6943 RepID=A0AAQ4DVP3_AMBAM